MQVPKKRSTRRHGLWVGVGMTLAIVVFAGVWAMINGRSSIDDTLPTAAVQTTKSILTPQEAAEVIGDPVRVEFVVGFVKRSGEVAYLYESEPKGDDLTFRVTLPHHIIAAMDQTPARSGRTPFKARLRLNGQVSREGHFAEILLGDSSQFEKIVYNDGLTTTPPQ